jgi:hypothetical protein
MMMKRMMTGLLAVSMLASMPGVAAAQESTTHRTVQTQGGAERVVDWVAKVKARALEAIDKRLVTIDELEAAINRSETITATHAEQLLAELAGSEAGLSSLAGQIRAGEDAETLWALVPQIFEDYRIYAVVAPKVRLVLGADGAGAVAGRLGRAADSLDTVIDRLADNGIDLEAARALLDEMTRLVESGAASAASVPGMVLDLTPADYPGSTEIIRSAHEVLQSAGSDLRAAGENAGEILRLIKDAVGRDGN